MIYVTHDQVEVTLANKIVVLQGAASWNKVGSALELTPAHPVIYFVAGFYWFAENELSLGHGSVKLWDNCQASRRRSNNYR